MSDVHIYGIQDSVDMYCIFFFRKTHATIKEKETIELFACVNNINEKQFKNWF